MQITYSKQAFKKLRGLQPKIAKTIRDKINNIAQGETKGLDIKALEGRNGFRLRHGDWRVIYTEDGHVLRVERVAPRGRVYKG